MIANGRIEKEINAIDPNRYLNHAEAQRKDLEYLEKIGKYDYKINDNQKTTKVRGGIVQL